MHERKRLKQQSKSALIDALLSMREQYQADSKKYHELLARNIELTDELNELKEKIRNGDV